METIKEKDQINSKDLRAYHSIDKAISMSSINLIAVFKNSIFIQRPIFSGARRTLMNCYVGFDVRFFETINQIKNEN